MSEEYVFQTSFKHGPLNHHGEPMEMTNVRGRTIEEFRNALNEVNSVAHAVYLASESLRAGGVGAQPVPTAGSNPQPPATNPEPAQVPQQPSGGPQLPAPEHCVHGQRNRVTGSKNGTPWVGDFCALPKGTAGACAPIFHDTK